MPNQQLKSVMGDPPGLRKFLRTDGDRWHRVDCRFKVRVLVLNPALPPATPSPSDAAPAGPAGRLVTENPAPETEWPFQENN